MSWRIFFFSVILLFDCGKEKGLPAAQCLAPASVFHSPRKLTDLLQTFPNIPRHLVSRVFPLVEREKELLAFFRMGKIEKIEVGYFRPERTLWGPMFSFVVQGSGQTKIFYAKLPRYFLGDGLNPTKLECDFTWEAAAAGIAPPNAVIGDALLTQHVEGAVSLWRLAEEETYFDFFLAHEEEILRKIGASYGILNRQLHILHGDVKLEHILVQRETQTGKIKIFLIDFSTVADEGELSQRIPRHQRSILNDEENLIRAICNFWEAIFPQFLKRGLETGTRRSRYLGWLTEGYESVSGLFDRSL